MTHPVIRRISERKWPVDFWNIRFVSTLSEELCVRQSVVQPTRQGLDEGSMVTVVNNGGMGYAATSDFSDEGIERVFSRAKNWANVTSNKLAFEPQAKSLRQTGTYQTTVKTPYQSVSLNDRLGMLKEASEIMGRDSRIVDYEASFSFSESTHYFVSSDGSKTEQEFKFFLPNLSATAHANQLTQFRTLNGRGYARQAGFEIFERLKLNEDATRIRNEALELLEAENCPQGKMDLILMPDQMMLQIHESIGHPLELDRILGDERNYAGTSFVTLDMFGSYQYGSSLLNVTFDPTLQGEFASYSFDDEGNRATKEYLIKDGILSRPMGSLLSQSRSQKPGIANGRASNWNRPPIDRMANLNLEPGHSTLKEMIESIKDGVLMHSNISWSIDDSRNKFQFGCEYGKRIKNGQIVGTIRNPNYRGISATFWRSLKMVGDSSTFEMYGTPFCGKGEPNQAIRVGHASPACLFDSVEVFGGESA